MSEHVSLLKPEYNTTTSGSSLCTSALQQANKYSREEEKTKAYSFVYWQLSQKIILDISWYAQHFSKVHNVTARIAVKRSTHNSMSLQGPIMQRWIHRHSSRQIILWRSTPSTKPHDVTNTIDEKNQSYKIIILTSLKDLCVAFAKQGQSGGKSHTVLLC